MNPVIKTAHTFAKLAWDRFLLSNPRRDHDDGVAYGAFLARL